MFIGAVQLTTESLLAWLIVAVGLLGFIIAHTVERWYKAVVPGLLSLGIVALGLYFVVSLARQPSDKETPEDKGTQAVEKTDDDVAEPDRTPLIDDEEPIAGGTTEPAIVETEPAEDLAQFVTASVPQMMGNPFYMASQQELKVTVRVKNTGAKPVRSVTVTCWVPYKRGPDPGKMSTPQTFDLDPPVQQGAEGEVIVTVDGIKNANDCGWPQVRVDGAS